MSLFRKSPRRMVYLQASAAYWLVETETLPHAGPNDCLSYAWQRARTTSGTSQSTPLAPVQGEGARWGEDALIALALRRVALLYREHRTRWNKSRSSH
ncbi:hypothetical protein PG985_003180 [Apiospora marii]|uniref:uncharacterized protein n=1 Tax=Apiospora marii TaxID=335849 RepID=UPI00312CFE8E